MRRQHKYLCGCEGTPLEWALQHSGPCDSIGHAKVKCQRFQFPLTSDLVGTRNDQAPTSVFCQSSSEPLDQDVDRLLWMNSTKSERQPFAAQFGPVKQEIFCGDRGVAIGTESAVRHNRFIYLVMRERLSRQNLLVFASEADCLGVAQDFLQEAMPVDDLFQMFERKSLFEVGIEHSMRKDKIRNASPGESPMGSNGVELPDAIDDNNVKARDIPSEPWDSVACIFVGTHARTKPMHFCGKCNSIHRFR